MDGDAFPISDLTEWGGRLVVAVVCGGSGKRERVVGGGRRKKKKNSEDTCPFYTGGYLPIQTVGGHLIPLSSSSRSLLFKSLTAASSSSSSCSLYLPNQFGRCYSGSHSQKQQEMSRAPSTAEEFKRVAEEKLREAEQGVAGQTFDKTCDAAEEAILDDGKLDSVRYNQHEPGADYRRRPDDH